MDTMFILGQYIFGLSTAAPAEFSRDTAYNWPAQDVFGMGQSLQFTGWGEETISLSGVIYTEFTGDTSQMNRMRDEADLATPLTLIDGRGNILGEWVIKQINERQDAFAQAGTPLKQHFNMSLLRYGGDEAVFAAQGFTASMLERLRNDQNGGLSGLLGMLASGVQAGGIASAALGAAGAVLSGVTAAREALSYVERGIDAAKDLQSAARSVQNAVSAIKNADDIGSLAGAIDSMIATADSASATAARSGTGLLGLTASMPQQLRGVVSAAGYASNQLATSAAKIGAGIQSTMGRLTK